MNIIIVDDELNTRQGIRDIVDWEKFGVRQGDIRLAENGLHALNIIKSFTPEILICDIRMPKMDGMELVGKLRGDGKLPQLQVVFLSAFSDKEYLKAAIKYGAVDYVEKPVDIVELEKSLGKAVTRLKNEKLAENAALEKIINGDATSLKHLAAYWKDAVKYHVFQLGVNCGASRKSEFDQIINDKITADFANSMCFEVQPNIWTVLVGTTKEKKGDIYIHGIYDDLCRQNLKAGCDFAISYSRNTNDIEEIPELIELTLSGTDSFFFHGYGEVYFISGKDILRIKNAGITEKFAKSFERIHNRSMLPKESEMLAVVADSKTPKQVRSSAFQILILISNHLKNKYPEYKQAQIVDIWQDGLDLQMTIDDVMDFMKNEADKMLRDVSEHLLKENSLEKVKRHIEKHYNKKISLNSLAKEYNYSSGYLSHIFKKTYGMGVCYYIIDLRLKKAKELMEDNNLALNEVSSKVGFSDYAHFSRTFKKAEGIAPRKWVKR